MHRPVERFLVNLQDPIGETRAGVDFRAAPGSRLVWLLLPMALALGMATAWLANAGSPFSATGRMAEEGAKTSRVAQIEPAHGGNGATSWLGDFLPAAVFGPRASGRGAGWPVILHRAGDGAFHADILAAGHEVHVRVDPAGTSSRLAEVDLPTGAVVEAGRWTSAEVELQHLRLPEVSFEIVGSSAEAVLGVAGLEPAVEVEESADRLRLARARR